MDDAAFLTVPANSRSEEVCSPAVPDEAVGLFLAAPSRILIPQDPAAAWRFVVCLSCGFSMLEDRRLRRDGLHNVPDSIAFMVSHPAAGFAAAGPMADRRDRPERGDRQVADPSEGMSDEEAAGHTWVVWANPDLREAPGVPTVPGTCFVHARLGGLCSNVVAVQLVSA